MKESVDIVRASGFSTIWAMMCSNLADMYYESGDLENAQRCANEALKSVQDCHGGFAQALVRTFSGRVLARTDSHRFAEAEKYALQGMSILEDIKARTYHAIGRLYWGEAYAEAGQSGRALESLKKAETMLRDMGMEGYYLVRTEKALAKLETSG